MPLVEEPGWRGFAMPRLAERYGWLRASWFVGVAWAAWHAVMFVLQGFDTQSFVLGMIMIAAGSVVFGWLFDRTRGSLLAAVIAHAGVHLDNPTRALPSRAPGVHHVHGRRLRSSCRHRRARSIAPAAPALAVHSGGEGHS